MGDGVKLPVIETVKLSVRWTAAILVKHWLLVAAFVVIPEAIFLPLEWMDVVRFPVKAISLKESQIGLIPILVIIVFGLFFIFIFISLALVTHNEILRGTAGLNAATLGRYGGRIFAYFGDSIILMLMMFCVAFIMSIIGTVFGVIFNKISSSNEIFGIVFAIVFAALFICGLLRLSLRFPSRAVAEVLPWKAVWALGRGNTLRLLGGQGIVYLIILLVALPFFGLQLWLQGGLIPNHPTAFLHAISGGPLGVGGLIPSHPPAFLPGVILSIVGTLLLAVETIFLCAFLSLAYAYLRNARPEPVRAEPRF